MVPRTVVRFSWVDMNGQHFEKSVASRNATPAQIAYAKRHYETWAAQNAGSTCVSYRIDVETQYVS